MSSPTVSLKAVMISCTIAVKEGRYIIVTDIPEARLHADMDDTVHMLGYDCRANSQARAKNVYKIHLEEKGREAHAVYTNQGGTFTGSHTVL